MHNDIRGLQDSKGSGDGSRDARQPEVADYATEGLRLRSELQRAVDDERCDPFSMADFRHCADADLYISRFVYRHVSRPSRRNIYVISAAFWCMHSECTGYIRPCQRTNARPFMIAP